MVPRDESFFYDGCLAEFFHKFGIYIVDWQEDAVYFW